MTLINISNGSLNVTTKNIFYWIAHYVFEDTDGITETLVKKRIMELATELKCKSENSKEKEEKNSESDNTNDSEESNSAESQSDSELSTDD